MYTLAVSGADPAEWTDPAELADPAEWVMIRMTMMVMRMLTEDA